MMFVCFIDSNSDPGCAAAWSASCVYEHDAVPTQGICLVFIYSVLFDLGAIIKLHGRQAHE